VVLRRRLILGVLALVLAGCSTNQFGPWYTPSGDIVSNGIMVEFQGFKECDTDKVVFIRFLGRQYAHDPEGQLGTLTADDGTVLTYAEFDSTPGGLDPTGVRHKDEEIWQGQSDVESYLYIVRDGGLTERWPRAEVSCQR
jgi:hypothetical protein